MVSVRVKVGPKGQVVIPKVFREAYGIKEGGEIIIIPTEEGLMIRGKKTAEEVMNILKVYREKRRGQGAVGRLGDLADFDLEEELDEDIS